MTKEESIWEQRARYKLLFRSSRKSYSDDDSDTNRTPAASVQQEEEVLYEIDPRALEKLPERLQNNYLKLFQERVERLSRKNPNFKYRQYDYMDYWPDEAFKLEEEEQPRYMKRQYPRKHNILQELGIMPVPQLQLQLTEQRGLLRVMNPDLSHFEDVSGQDTDECKYSAGHSEEKEINNGSSEKIIDEALAMLFNTAPEKGSLPSPMEEECRPVNTHRKVDSRPQERGTFETQR
ncbi:hypothetical protein EMCG_06556 [[Emmonsia] crescens]|uniref:Uncharacterized protein n=1 Tax=[Emmonsia] crescens TaxID=73230 RepID=A0A0G2IBX5_9EURO|nr:hypothetical protein EMCG_06556 [Emmonsia crescens UAMH 3008]